MFSHHHYRLAHQLAQQVQHLPRFHPFAGADRLGCLQSPAACKHGETAEQEALSPLPELGPLPSPDGTEAQGEVSRHLRAAAQAAARQAEEALPTLPDKLRVFIGAGLAAMMAVATAFFALARLGALP